MKLQIEAASLQEALRVIARLAPPVSGNVTIESDGKKVFAISNSDTSRCTVNMPARVKGEASFAISLQALKDATKGRKELNVVYEQTLCKISGGNYKCDLPTVDAIQVEHEKETKGEAIKLTTEQAKWLKSAVTTVTLKPTALLAAFMPVTIKLTEKAAFVSCYDNLHMSFLNSKEIQGDMELTVPIDVLLAVLDTFPGAFKLEVGSSNLYVTNALVKVALSLPQEDASIQADAVIAKAREVSKADGSEIEVSKTDILEFLDNARAVATKERSEIRVSTEKGKLKLGILTTSGSIKTLLKASCPAGISARIDFEFLDEAVRKCGDSVIMKIVGDSFAAFKMKNSTVLISLNQE